MSDSEGFEFGREIKVRLVFAAVAGALGIGVASFTDVSQLVAFGIVILLGIIAPRAYLYATEA